MPGADFNTMVEVATGLYRKLEPYSDKLIIAGSLRRKKQDNIKDIDIVMKPDISGWRQLLRYLSTVEFIKKSSLSDGMKQFKAVYRGIPIEIYFAHEYTWAVKVFIRTGPVEFVKSVCKYAYYKQRKIEYSSVWEITGKGQRPIATPDEKSVFKELSLKYVEPQARIGSIWDFINERPREI